MPVYDPGVPWLRGTATLTSGSTTVTTDGVITLNEILEGDRLYARDDDTILGPFEIVGGEGAELELRESFTGSTGSYPVAIDRNPITRTGAKTLRDVARILATIEDADVEVIGEIRDETVAAKEAAEALYGDLTAVQQAKTEAEEAAGDARDDAILTAQLVGQAATHADNADASAQAAAQSKNAAAQSAHDADISAGASQNAEQNIAALTGDFTGSYDTYVFTAAGSETSLSGQDDSGKTLSYSPGTASVFKNGVKLIAGSDYSATDGSSITDLDPLEAGDKVEVQAFNLFSVIDSVRRSQNLADLGDWPAAVRNLGEVDDGEALLDDTSMAYGVGPRRVSPGDLIRVRAEGQAFEVADPEASGGRHFATAGGVVLRPPPRDPNAVPNIEALALLRPIFHDQIARVVHNRHFGYFKWRSGDVSPLVSADPYRGLWVPPASDTSGASGAWQRVVERGVYDAEWWLPDTMPSDAQNYLNDAIASLPDSTARKMLFPARETLISGPIRLTKGLIYEGALDEGVINGRGGAYFAVIAQASNARLKRIKAGNVAGGLYYGEAGGFHIYDGTNAGTPDDPQVVENVGVEDCETYDAECGLRFGFTGGPGYQSPGAPLAASKDCWATDFTGRNIRRIGIEYFWCYDVEVRNPRIEMAKLTEADPGGFKRGMRLANARKTAVIGGSIKGPVGSAHPVHGLSCENASMITFEGVRLENLVEYLRFDQSEDITASGIKAIGWADLTSGWFISVVNREGTINRNIHISGCTAINLGCFLSLRGPVHGMQVLDNYYVGNGSASSQMIVNNGNGEASGLIIRGNTLLDDNPALGQGMRIVHWPAGCDMTLDDNVISGEIFIASSAGDGIVRSRNRYSNRKPEPGLWSKVRPPFEQKDYDHA